MKKEDYLSIFLLLASILIFFFLVYPKYQSLYSLKSQALQKKEEYQNLEIYHQQLREIFEKLKNYQDSLSKIEFALPENPSLPEFFDFIQKLASLSGLSLSQISSSLVSEAVSKGELAPPPSEKELKEWKIALTLNGDYYSFKNFLSSLEKSARLVEINKISFSSSKEKGIFDFNLDIKIRGY
jgi:Tfp pilus assembly protein PilO